MVLIPFVLQADILITRHGPRSLSMSLRSSVIFWNPHRNLSLVPPVGQLREEMCSPPVFATTDCKHAIH
jgi:hypothetical protein